MTVAVATLVLNVAQTCILHISILATGILSASTGKCLLVHLLATCYWVIMQAAEPQSLRKRMRLSVHHRLTEEQQIILSTSAAEPEMVLVHCRLQSQRSSNQGESSQPDLERSTPQLLESAAKSGTAAVVKPNFQRHSMGATSDPLSRSPSAKRRCVA